jgi:hypothetical protein
VAGNRITVPTIGGDQTFDAGVGLDHDRHAPERTARAAAGSLGILASCGLERLPLQYLFDRPVDPVVPVNPRKVPPNDLRDRVLVLGVVALELRHRHLEEVAVHCVRSESLQSRRR